MFWLVPKTSRNSAVRYDRVEVSNPSDGGFWYWLFKFYAFAACCLVGLLALAGLGLVVYFATTLPSLPSFERFRQDSAESTLVRAWDGTPLAEFASERREILAFEAFPKRLVQALVAIEDRRFYQHSGVDFRGMVRAAFANLRAGRVVQGGSTITQQVARALLRTSEQTLQRKIREALLARRLEARYTKDQILTIYLNQIFLGHQSYGVAAAARRYFDKAVGDLDLAEMATIAGIAQAPSRYSPLNQPDLTRARRDQVLAAMVTAGFADESEARNASARPISVAPPVDFFRERSPYFAEHVRRDIGKRYGEKALWEGGLQVEATLVPWIDLSAQENVDFSLRKLDKRQGWRGPVAHLTGAAAEAFRRRASQRYGGEPPAEDRLYLGLVESASGAGAQVRVGERIYPLPAAGMQWAVPFSMVDSTNGRALTSTAGVLKPGDVIWVANAHHSRLRRYSDWTYDGANEVQWLGAYDHRKPPALPQLRLEQTPRVQGVLHSYDHQTGYVQAMVGGHEFDRSEFNRAVQACRQPGSTYKPIYYSLALDKGYGFGSLLNDIPRAEVDPITGEVWVPKNLNNTVEYQVNLEYALVWSKNVPSVQLFKLVGGKEVESWARRLGITTPIIPDQALALGASCTRIDELTRAFSAFARNGSLQEPVYVRRVRDRSGNVLEDNTAASDPMGPPHVRLDRMVALAGKAPKNVIPARTAWLTSQLLRRVVTKGHAPALRSTGLLVGGKTGTSSATMDTWFVGYTSRSMITTWIGDDRRERPLGFKDAAFMLTVPMAARFLWETTVGQSLRDIPWERPPGVRPNDTGGNLRATMEAVKAEDEAAAHKRKG
ncbi:MAG TPA: transglycosylase domain-containing protein [Polyangia bacterium]